MAFVRNMVRRLIRRMGYQLVPNQNAPSLTFLGIGSRAVDTVIDVGANRGQFARQARKFFPNAVIHCFEPLPEAAEALKKWAASEAGQVDVHQMAVGAESGKVMMWEHIDHDPSSSLLQTTDTTEELFPQTRRRRQVQVSICTLDAIFGDDLTTRFGRLVVKVDVQGFEDRVVAGGQRIFSIADVAILEIAVRQLYEGQPTFAKIVNELGKLGLSYIGNLDQHHDAMGQPIYFDAVFARRYPFSIGHNGK